MESRTSVIEKRLEHINRIIAVASGKGGLKNLKGEGTWELSMTTFELVYTGEVWLE